MGYLHINNLYKDQNVLLFKQVYAMEKIDGTSSSIIWKNNEVILFSGGAKHQDFVNIFNGIQAPTLETIKNNFISEFGDMKVVIYGEAYGGKIQGRSNMYGKNLKFIAFDVKVGEAWLSVPKAHNVVKKFGLEFVDYVLVDAIVDELDKERDKESTQAIRNGCGNNQKREGIIIRPPIELTLNNGERVIAKHKREDFSERKTSQKIINPEELKIYEKDEEAAEEFVTDMRLEHVMSKIFLNGETPDINKTGDVIKAMIEDIFREAKGEIVETKQLRVLISKKTASMFKSKIKKIFENNNQ